MPNRVILALALLGVLVVAAAGWGLVRFRRWRRERNRRRAAEQAAERVVR